MIKNLSLTLGLVFLAGCCCMRPPQPIVINGQKFVCACMINETAKRQNPKDDGMWPMPKPVDLSMYKNACLGARGEITASHPGYNEKEMAQSAFDGKQETKYCTSNTTPWIQFAFPAGSKPAIVAYALISANDSESRDPRNFTLQGSDDGKAWTDVDKQQKVSFDGRFNTKLFELKAPAAFNCYRLKVDANNGDEKDFQIAEIQLLMKK